MKTQKSHSALGASLVVVSSLFYATYGIWTKLMGNFFGGYAASALRSILAVAILLCALFGLRKAEPLKLRITWPYLLGMTVASLIIWGPLYYAFLHAGIGITLIANYASYIIATFFFGWLLAHEKFTKEKYIATILGFVGLALVYAPSIESFGVLAIAGAVVSGLGGGLTIVLSKKIPYNPMQSTTMLWISSAIANIFMAIVLRQAIPAFSLRAEWLYLVCFAVASVLASMALVRGVKLIDAGVAGIIGLLEIVFGILFGVIFFAERPGVLSLIGALIIIAAAAIPYVKQLVLSNKR